MALRALEPEDIDILYLWENDTDVWRMSRTLAPFSRHVLRQFIENQRHDIYETGQLRLIVESVSTGEPVGAVDLFEIDPINARAGVGLLIYRAEDRRRGYAAEALNLLIRYSFASLGLHQLHCNISAENTPSLHLFKQAGFTTVGLKQDWIRTTLGWQHEYMLQLLNAEQIR